MAYDACVVALASLTLLIVPRIGLDIQSINLS